jgi:hypothetical protein
MPIPPLWTVDDSLKNSTLNGRQTPRTDLLTVVKLLPRLILSRIVRVSTCHSISEALLMALSIVVKTQPKAASSDFGGFKVVKAKGKGRK